MISAVHYHAVAATALKIAVLIFIVSVPFLAVAQTIPPYRPFGTDAQLSTDPKTAIETIVIRIANIFGTLILAISVIMILYAAFNFLTAAGDEAKVTTARTTLIYALVGIAVALLAYVLPGLVVRLILNPSSGGSGGDG